MSVCQSVCQGRVIKIRLCQSVREELSKIGCGSVCQSVCLGVNSVPVAACDVRACPQGLFTAWLESPAESRLSGTALGVVLEWENSDIPTFRRGTDSTLRPRTDRQVLSQTDRRH